MVERGCGPGFALESLESLRVPGQFVRKEFQSDMAAEAQIFGLIDHTHPAAAQLLNDAVVRNRSPGEWRRIGHWRESWAEDEGQVNLRAGFLRSEWRRTTNSNRKLLPPLSLSALCQFCVSGVSNPRAFRTCVDTASRGPSLTPFR